MRKTVLVLAASFFTFCSGIPFAYAAMGDEVNASTTEIVTTTVTQITPDEEGGFVFDEETALHMVPIGSTEEKPEVLPPSAKEETIIIEEKDIPRLLLQLKIERNALLREQNRHLELIAKNSSLALMLQDKGLKANAQEREEKAKAKEEREEKEKQVPPISTEAQSMFT
jgi:hypothetical protein